MKSLREICDMGPFTLNDRRVAASPSKALRRKIRSAGQLLVWVVKNRKHLATLLILGVFVHRSVLSTSKSLRVFLAGLEDDWSSGDSQFSQNKQGVYPLEFVHIPLTGGLHVERVASENGIAWGACKFEAGSRDLPYSQCRDESLSRRRLRFQSSKDWKCGIGGTYPWHCPPVKLESGNKYEDVETFTIVRNPYDRMIAEYYDFFDRLHHDDLDRAELDINSPKKLNKWVRDAIRTTRQEGTCYLGHCIEFYKFVYSKEGERLVHHVLKYENLQMDFDNLMQQYEIPLSLSGVEVYQNKTNRTLTRDDFFHETVTIINKWAKNDFKWFGYDPIRYLSSERNSSLIYFPQNERGMHPLEFVHIPKTGGTSIERAAAEAGIAWGICHFSTWSRAHCRHIPKKLNDIKIQSNTTNTWKCRLHGGAPHHCPLTKFVGEIPYKGVDTFAVVRNPYTRMISEYYYYFTKIPKKGYESKETGEVFKIGETSDLNDPKLMNQWIRDAVWKAKYRGSCYQGHCVLYHAYIYSEKGEKLVTHVLKMETLNEDFERLMDQYKLGLKLQHKNVRISNTTLGVDELSDDVVELINDWSKKDFELFGYELIQR